MIDDDAAPEDQIKGLRHGAIHCYKAACILDHEEFGSKPSKIMNVIDSEDVAWAKTHTSPARAKSRIE